MANTRVTALDEATSLASNDVFLVEDVSAGESKKVTVETTAAGVGTELGLPSLTVVAGRDDFDSEADAWVTIESATGATLKQGSSLSNNGFPSSGVHAYSIDGTAGAKLMRLRPAGLCLDATVPIVVEAVLTVANAGVVADDACEWYAGILGGSASNNAVAVVALLSPGRVHKLRTLTAGVAVDEAITLPVWTESLRLRLSVTPTGTVVSAAADGGALATIFTSAEVPPSTIYHPMLRLARETGAGNRVLAVDWVSWSGARDASAPGVAYDTLRTVTPMSAYLPLAGGSLTGAVSTSSTIDGRDIATDGAKLDGIEAGADVTDAANVLAALAANTADVDVNAEKIVDLATGTAATDAANVGQVQQPAGRSVSGTTDTIVAGDIGNVILYSQAGGVTVDLPDLSGSLISGRAIVLTLQATNAATVITVDPGASVTIDGSASNFVATAGKSRVSLISLDGLAFYSGTP